MIDSCSNTDILSSKAAHILGLDVRRGFDQMTVHTVAGATQVPMATTTVWVSHIEQNVGKQLKDVKIMSVKHF